MQETTTPLAESLHIVLAGITNAGKSSLLNALFQKDIAVVSDQRGTTTDPVTRKIELGSLGACSVTDTAGLDDTGELAAARIAKTRERILTADFVLFVSPCDRPVAPCERELLARLRERNTPFIAVLSFADRADNNITAEKESLFTDAPCVKVTCHPEFDRSRFCGRFISGSHNKEILRQAQNDDISRNPHDTTDGIEALLRAIESRAALLDRELTPVEGIVRAGDTVILVTPIDSAAPKGRLILPQVETLRDLLDRDCNAIVVKENGLKTALDLLKNPPDLIITDSQAFKQVAAILPPSQPLTSFSILFARKKGGIDYFLQSLDALEHFPPDGTVLIMEACSHHRKEDDIGTVKIPALFKKRFGGGVRFVWSRELPSEIALRQAQSSQGQKINLVIHCGACMLTRNAMTERVGALKAAGIPVLNYGLFLAWADGLFPRAIGVLPETTFSQHHEKMSSPHYEELSFPRPDAGIFPHRDAAPTPDNDKPEVQL